MCSPRGPHWVSLLWNQYETRTEGTRLKILPTPCTTAMHLVRTCCCCSTRCAVLAVSESSVFSTSATCAMFSATWSLPNISATRLLSATCSASWHTAWSEVKCQNGQASIELYQLYHCELAGHVTEHIASSTSSPMQWHSIVSQWPEWRVAPHIARKLPWPGARRRPRRSRLGPCPLGGL